MMREHRSNEVSFAGKWVDLIYKVATGSWKTKLVLAPIAGLTYLSLIVLFIMLSFEADRLLHFPEAIVHPWSLIFGISLIILGMFLMFLSVSYFIRVRGTPAPFLPPPKLVTTGPYRFVRNPMLSGLLIQLFGLGIALGSISLVFIFTPLIIIINVWELKNVEEPELLKRFGKDYVDYRKRVPMFFPLCIKK
jgi:protein-S-isoprenylcysteine O-methyltransferase Ste14